jgi:hypothetical protein
MRTLRGLVAGKQQAPPSSSTASEQNSSSLFVGHDAKIMNRHRAALLEMRVKRQVCWRWKLPGPTLSRDSIEPILLNLQHALRFIHCWSEWKCVYFFPASPAAMAKITVKRSSSLMRWFPLFPTQLPKNTTQIPITKQALETED